MESKKAKLRETAKLRVHWWFPGAGGRGERGVTVSGYRVSFGGAEKVLEIHRWCSYNIMNVLNATKLYAIICLGW